MVDADPQAQFEDRLMLLRTASALVIVVACCGIAAAADLELLPKGSPKARPAQPSAPSVTVPQPAPPPAATPAPQPPAVQEPAAPTKRPEAPAPRTLPQEAPGQQPSAPQQLQSPPVEHGKPALDDDRRLNDLQMPEAPPPVDGESWWQKVVRSAPNCRTFSDGCRTCDAKFSCSSMPIACQPKEFVCTDPATPQPSK